MKTHRFVGLFVLICAVLTGLAVPTARADNSPVWTLLISSVPATTFSSDASSLEFVVSDSAGNGLVVVAHTIDFGSGPQGAGLQLLLLSSRGKLLASGEIPTVSVQNTALIPLSVTTKRLILLIGGQLNQGTIDEGGKLVFTPLPFETAGEVLLDPAGISEINHKFLHTTVSAGNKVTEIRRYALTKLKPVP
jgi:hypothetical protein